MGKVPRQQETQGSAQAAHAARSTTTKKSICLGVGSRIGSPAAVDGAEGAAHRFAAAARLLRGAQPASVCHASQPKAREALFLFHSKEFFNSLADITRSRIERSRVVLPVIITAPEGASDARLTHRCSPHVFFWPSRLSFAF